MHSTRVWPAYALRHVCLVTAAPTEVPPLEGISPSMQGSVTTSVASLCGTDLSLRNQHALVSLTPHSHSILDTHTTVGNIPIRSSFPQPPIRRQPVRASCCAVKNASCKAETPICHFSTPRESCSQPLSTTTFDSPSLARVRLQSSVTQYPH